MAWNHINENLTTENRRTRATVHGYKYHPLYSVYQGMMTRCHKEGAHNFDGYGARGISVCLEWRGNPVKFIEWGISIGYQHGLYLDRRDNNGDYSPENCQWATPLESARNRRSTKLCVADAAVIKDLALRGVPQKLIGALYGIVFQAVSDIKRNKNWLDAGSLFVQVTESR